MFRFIFIVGSVILLAACGPARFKPEVSVIPGDSPGGDAAGDPAGGDTMGDPGPGDPGPCPACAANDNGGSGGPIASGLGSTAIHLFQVDATSRAVNRDDGAPKPNGTDNPYSIGAYADPNDDGRIKFFVNDRGNNRVMIFNDVPADATALPDVVVGQADFLGSAPNAGQVAVNAAGLDDNVHVSVCSTGQMLITDRNNHRILVFNQVPVANGAAADFVIGQGFVTENTPAAGRAGLNTPYAAYCIADRLVVVDRGNHRVLIYAPVPTVSFANASVVVGQPDFDTVTPACAADRFDTPYEILVSGGDLYVADGFNNRVLRYDGIPNALGAAPVAVLGQTNFTTCTANQSSLTALASGLDAPNGLAANSKVLAVSDHDNQRIVLFELPITTGEAAVAVLGQPDFSTTLLVDPPTATSVRNPKGMVFDGAYLWIGDNGNHRVFTMPLPDSAVP